MDVRSLPQLPHGSEQRALQCFTVGFSEALARESVTDETMESGNLAIFVGKKRAVALRTGERDQLTLLVLGGECFCRFGSQAIGCGRSLLGYELPQRRGNLVAGKTIIDRNSPEHCLRHARHKGFLRILNNDQATSGFDRYRAGRAVIESAGQNNSNDTRAIIPGGAPEKGIDGGPMTVL